MKGNYWEGAYSTCRGGGVMLAVFYFLTWLMVTYVRFIIPYIVYMHYLSYLHISPIQGKKSLKMIEFQLPQ